MDEETSGDGYWFIVATTSTMLDEQHIMPLANQMEDIAQETNVEYRGWKVITTAAEERRLKTTDSE